MIRMAFCAFVPNCAGDSTAKDRTIGERFSAAKALHAIQHRCYVRVDHHEPSVGWLDESFAHAMIEKIDQSSIVILDIQQTAWFSMNAQLRPSDDFTEFLEGTEPSR